MGTKHLFCFALLIWGSFSDPTCSAGKYGCTDDNTYPGVGNSGTLTLHFFPFTSGDVESITVMIYEAKDTLITGTIAGTSINSMEVSAPASFTITVTVSGGTTLTPAYTGCIGVSGDNAWLSVQISCNTVCCVLPNVIGPSSASGDPHFFGQKYDVMGQSHEIYNLLTSPQLQINSRFTPYFRLPNQIVPTGTMMGELGIKFAGHALHLMSNESFAYLDGNMVSLKTDWLMAFGDTTLQNSVHGTKYEIGIKNSDVAITFMQKVYMHAGLEAQWHYDYRASLINEKPDLHGLLGQTWEDKYFANKESDAFKHLDGYEDDYRVKNNDIFGDDFTFNKFLNM